MCVSFSIGSEAVRIRIMFIGVLLQKNLWDVNSLPLTYQANCYVINTTFTVTLDLF